MKKWLTRIRAALGVGVVWALAWGLGGGFIMEAIVDPNGRIVDMWPQALAIPGFLAGVAFSLVLWMTEGRRRFDELSAPRVALWGAVAGALIVALGIAIGLRLPVAAVLLAPVTVLSASSAVGTLALARKGTDRRAINSEDAARELR